VTRTAESHGCVVLVSNPAARSAEKHSAELKEIAARSDVELIKTSSREETIAAVSEAAARKVAIVAVAGGDGTVNAAVNALVEIGLNAPALSILPCGTGNDLARTLGIPLDLSKAVELWAQPRIRRIDVAALDCCGSVTWFANVATSGDVANSSSKLKPETKQRWGPLAFLRGAVPEIVDPTVYDLRLRLDDGDEIEERVLAAVFANGRTAAGGLEVAPHASCEDGRLDVMLIREGTVVDLATLAARYLVGDLLASDLVALRRVRTVSLHAQPALPLSVDGEDAGPANELSVRLLPRALQVLVGPGYEETAGRAPS